MKKSPASKKGSKTYVVSGDRKSKEGKTTKVYRKDGSLKSERNVKDAGTKKETRYSASPRTLTRSKKQVDVKDPATRSYTKYKKDGTVKKSITVEDAANKRGTGVDVKVSRKINRKLTDSEVFGFSQVNSEHCRHKIFNGTFIINDIEKEDSLFQMIKKTTKLNNNSVVSAYKDNVAFIKGPKVEQFSPKYSEKPSI